MKRPWALLVGVMAGAAGGLLALLPEKEQKRMPALKGQPTDRQVEFVRRLLMLALQVEKEYRVPADFALAQAAVETGWGTSLWGNNYFGLKATGWNGRKKLLWTWEFHDSPDVKYPQVKSVELIPRNPPAKRYKYRVRDYFRAYDTALDSFVDYASLLRRKYSRAFVTQDPFEFAGIIGSSSYATSPVYRALLNTALMRVQSIRQQIA